MNKAHILTPWVGDGSEDNPNHPLLSDAFPKIQTWRDITGQPCQNLHPDPNLYVVEVICDKEILNSIEADPRFFVIWGNDVSNKDDKPSTKTVSDMRTWLTSQSLSSSQATSIVKTSKTFEQISDELRTYLKTRPKKDKSDVP